MLGKTPESFLPFLTVFYPFTPLWTQKIKILKEWKKHLKILFYKCVPKMTVIWCMVPEIWSTTEFFVILDHFVPFYPLNNLKNQNFGKMKKTPGDIIILQKSTKNNDHMLYCSWNMVHDRCNCYISF